MEMTGNMGNKKVVTPAAALEGFGPDFLDEVRCREWVIRQLHPAAFSCPGCGEAVTGESRVSKFTGGERLSCASCGKKFNALTGTLLSGSHLGYRKLVLLLWLIGQKFSPVQISGLVGIDPTTVRGWKNKLEEAA